MAARALAQGYLPKMGGPGGAPFDAPCPSGQNLAGFELRAADDIDAITPVCVTAFGPHDTSAPVLSTNSGLVPTGPLSLVRGTVSAPGWYGGNGGQLARVLCPAATPIVTGLDVVIEGVDTRIVDSIRLHCGEASSGQQAGALPTAIFESPAYAASPGWLGIGIEGASGRRAEAGQRCPAGQVAVGMHGRSGVWLDAMGLVCDAPRLTAPPRETKALGRVAGSGAAGPEMSVCDAARSARARNSPAAPGLEAQCQALGVKAIGRVGSTAAPQPMPDLCTAAASARARNSPAASGLEAQCRALNDQRIASGEVAAGLVARGEVLAGEDPSFAELREQQPEGPARRGFAVGLAAAEGQSAPGAGKEKIRASLPADERSGFDVAVSFSLDRNRNTELAASGAVIAEADPGLAEARGLEPDARYRLGFDIASGIFGDAALGGLGNTATGPGSLAIRNGLNAVSQRGFDSAVALHLSRNDR